MNHLFVPYEIALQLKEKGFDEPCFGMYFLDESFSCDGGKHILPCKNSNTVLGTIWFSAPLYQQVIDWFREKHEFWIHLESYNDNKWSFIIEDISKKGYTKENGNERFMPRMIHNSNELVPYNESLNKAIEQALKLI